MPGRRPLLTPQLQRDICAYIRQGAFPEVAAEAAGLPRALFRTWLKRGEKGARKRYRAFAAAVRQAAAHARVLAEVETVKKQPLAWLKHGPGRETADLPGWTQPARPEQSPAGGSDQVALSPELRELFAALLGVLAPFPEARAAAAEVVGTFSREALPNSGQRSAEPRG
jgi:hypothetical protein